MKTQYSTYWIRNALEREIAAALNEPAMVLNIQISEINVEENCIVKGFFSVTSLFAAVARRKGTFEAKLDENLKILNLKIAEETKQ